MNKPLDERYLTWLYSQIGSIRLRNPERTFWSLSRQLYTTEFVWIVPNDDNRVADGLDLRREFLDGERVDKAWMDLGCSMLEMMIALSRRLAFEAEGEPRDWFWLLIDNLGLSNHSDAHCVNYRHFRQIEETLNRVIWRTYASNGRGGLFPLRRAPKDQTQTEIWYQLNAYLLENY